MCGRYASTRSSVDLAALFEAVDETAGVLQPDYNVAPTDPVPIVRRTGVASTAPGASRVPGASRLLSVARWGLVPPWSRDPSGGARMINARAETVATSRAFAQSFTERRCLVPADGWYEWLQRSTAWDAFESAGSDAASKRGAKTRTPAKQPYFMTRRDGGVLAFGGIWCTWGAPGSRLLTFSVVTLPAQGELARVHDRMPLVLEPALWWRWLTAPDASDLLVAASPEYLGGIELRPVSTAVGDVRNDGPDLVREVSALPLLLPPIDQSTPTLF